MGRLRPEQAYPGLEFRPRSRNWWARLSRYPAECVHLEFEHDWMATFAPDTLYLRGKAAPRRGEQGLTRPEVSLCRACLLSVMEPELAGYAGRVVAVEPDGAVFSQYFFVGDADFEAAGVKPEVIAALAARLKETGGKCEKCSRSATWLWLSRAEVSSLDDVALVHVAPGQRFCPAHGAARLAEGFQNIAEANLFYVNLPYGPAGAYLWI